MPQASTWSASSSTPQRDEHWTSLFLFLALTIVFLVMLKQGNKRRFEEDSFEDHKDIRWKFIEGGEYKCLFPGCGKASNQVSQSTAWKQRNRTFQMHIKNHNWNVPRLPVSTSERGFEGDAAEQHQNGDKFVRFEQTPAIEVEKRIESLRFITNEEKHLLQLAWVKKKYQTFSNKAFDALFHRVDWAIALPPQEISWRKTDNVIAKYLPVWDSEVILCGSQEIPYVSVSTITNKIVTLKNHKLGGWPAPRSDSLLTDVYDGMYWRTLLQEGFFTWGDKEEKRNLVFALYCDGFAKFRTKGHSTTGVYLIPLNLPIHERMKKKNWFTVAVVPKTLKKKEPTEEELLENYRENLMVILERLAKDFNSLESGTWIPNPINATIRVRLGLVVADLPALAEILCKVFPTGTRACHVCLQDFREWLEFSEDSTKLRSHQGTLTQASVVELAKKQALDTTLLEQSHGISGKTPLFEMANFDFTRNVAIDAMHNLPMGICKASITDSIEGTLASESRDNLAKVERAESVLKSARHTDMDRNRSLKNLKSYTAYEWLFLVRFGLPIFAALGADDHLEHLGDLFYVALNWLSSKIPAESLSSLSEAYRKTMRSRRDRFGWTKGDLNSHLPVHYEQLIKMWGPLIAFWCWAMERQNQSLKKIIDGGNNKNVEQYVMKELLVTSDLIEFIEPTLLPKTTGQSKAHPHRPTEKVVDFQEPQRCLWLLPEVWDSTLRLAPGDVFGLDGHGPRQFFYLECITLNASEEVELWTAPLRLLPPPNFGRMSPYFLNLESETSLPLSTINVAVYKRFLLSTLKPKLFPFFVVQERDERLYKFLKVVVSLVPERFPLLHQLKIDLVDGE